MNDEKAQQLGEYIRYLRKECNMTIRELADRAGIDQGGLTRLEQGATRAPRPGTLCLIAAALDVSVANMFAIVGYTVPQDLPSIEHYLKVKYSYIPDDDAWEICQAVEQVARLYRPNPVPSDMPRQEPSAT